MMTIEEKREKVNKRMAALRAAMEGMPSSGSVGTEVSASDASALVEESSEESGESSEESGEGG